MPLAMTHLVTVKVATATLVTNTYDARTSKLTNTAYGNGQSISNDYDSLDRVTAKKYNGNIRFKYAYDANGNVGYHQDLINSENYRYIYDLSDRIVTVKNDKGYSTGFEYDKNTNISKLNQLINGASYVTDYAYDNDNQPKTTSYTRNGITNALSVFDVL